MAVGAMRAPWSSGPFFGQCDRAVPDAESAVQSAAATGNAPVLPDLLAQIPADEQIRSVGGDGAYDTKKRHAAIAERDAEAVIPVRRNGRTWKEDGPGPAARNETLRAIKRLGRTIWKKWGGYHRRRLVETKMHCFKLLGQRVMARTFDRQITELKVRAAILNRFSQSVHPTPSAWRSNIK